MQRNFCISMYYYPAAPTWTQLISPSCQVLCNAAVLLLPCREDLGASCSRPRGNKLLSVKVVQGQGKPASAWQAAYWVVGRSVCPAAVGCPVQRATLPKHGTRCLCGGVWLVGCNIQMCLLLWWVKTHDDLRPQPGLGL